VLPITVQHVRKSQELWPGLPVAILLGMELPSTVSIEQLHRKYAPDEASFEEVYDHCRIVAAIALELLMYRPQPVDIDFVRVGCLLHDIGAYRFYKNGQIIDDSAYIRHGVEGEAILAAEEYPEALQRVASHHTGAGLDREQIIRRRLPLPAQDYYAETAEERVIMYADKYHSKNPRRLNAFDTYVQKMRSIGADNLSRFLALEEEFGRPDLAALSKVYDLQVV
jgi:uncharacterized protein